MAIEWTYTAHFKEWVSRGEDWDARIQKIDGHWTATVHIKPGRVADCEFTRVNVDLAKAAVETFLAERTELARLRTEIAALLELRAAVVAEREAARVYSSAARGRDWEDHRDASNALDTSRARVDAALAATVQR